MRKDNQFCLGQMLDSAEKALRLAKGKDREDYDIAWETVTEELPPLVGQLKRLVRQ